MKKVIVLIVICVTATFVSLYTDEGAFETHDSFMAVFQLAPGVGDVQNELVPISMTFYAEPREWSQAALQQEESFLCLWSSIEITPVGPTCDVTITTIDALCSPEAGQLMTASAIYRANASKVGSYLAVGSVSWGYLPGLPTGWCWTLMVDYSWGGIPAMPNPYWLDRAGAYGRSSSIPPILDYCAWPLSSPPAPFLFHCP
jgi:hypothetical protein